MLTNRPLFQYRSTAIILGLGVLLALMAFAAFNIASQNMGAGSNLAAVIPAAGGAASQRFIEAYAARLAGQAKAYAPVNAYAARWQGLAEAHLHRQQLEQAYAERSAGMAELPSRSVIAYAARWQGLATHYAAVNAYAARLTGLAQAHRQRAIDAYAARWNGLAEAYLNQ